MPGFFPPQGPQGTVGLIGPTGLAGEQVSPWGSVASMLLQVVSLRVFRGETVTQEAKDPR